MPTPEKPKPAVKPTIPAKPTGPTKEQIEAAKKLKAASPVVVASTPVDPDAMPTAPAWSGKDADFPAWVAADMRFKESYGNWMARRKK